METLNHKLVELALERVSGSAFEDFFQAFYAAVVGAEFIPLGGVHDGGADAFLDAGLFSEIRPSYFYQASKEKDHRAKLRQTVDRLRATGRTPNVLHYCTPRAVRLLDQEEDLLSTELNVIIRIRDRRWITNNINHSSKTIQAYRTHLEQAISFLQTIGGATTIGIPDASVRTMCVFLGQEVDRRRGNTHLLEAVTDSLILWALEGTDPATNTLMSRVEILAKIQAVLPSAKDFVRRNFNERINLMASKQNQSGREVRRYEKHDRFCLPYQTRQLVAAENAEDEYLKLVVLELYTHRATDLLHQNDSISPEQIARAVHRALELTFEHEGLALAEFLTGTGDVRDVRTIADQFDTAWEEMKVVGARAVRAKEVALQVLTQAFYSSTTEERIYYGKLSRTYALLFTLRNEPKIIEYFRGMSSNFVLFVGSDIVIRALSERYLPAEDQMTVNMLKILREAGSALILTAAVVEEVQAHLVATDAEFRNVFADMEDFVDRRIAQNAGRILIRTYFYAKLDKRVKWRPRAWKSFMEQFCSYGDLHRESASRVQVGHYLVEKFGFDYIDSEELERLTEESEVQHLAGLIRGIKWSEILARNDALHILAVYGKRKELKEDHHANPYGYRVWWLTQEARVVQSTRELVRQRGARYIMRPEFILNFVALSPATAEVRKSYNSVFPTVLGVKLSNRMREDVFQDVMKRAKDVRAVDEARARAMMTELSNRLKGDELKEYEVELEG